MGTKGLFQVGNQLAKKLSTLELKQEAYQQYCNHIASGKSHRSFVFEHPEISLTWETMEKYIKDEPSVFDPVQRKNAEAKSLEHWEAIGKEMMLGKVKGCQPAIYQIMMRNKFKWDRESIVSHSFEPEVRKLLDKLEGNE